MTIQELWISLLSGLIGANIAALITWLLNRQERDLALKKDVLRRFLGYRFRLTGRADLRQTDEPFVALNEVVVVFSDCPDVISSLLKMHQELGQANRLVDNIITLIKSMARACRIPANELNDSFFERPFTPRVATPCEEPDKN